MKTYQIEITEKLQQIVNVKAPTKDDALNIINEQYNNEDIVLDYSDFSGKEIKGYDESDTNKLCVLMNQVIDYLWEDEEKHFLESGKPEKHIYLTLKRIKDFI